MKRRYRSRPPNPNALASRGQPDPDRAIVRRRRKPKRKPKEQTMNRVVTPEQLKEGYAIYDGQIWTNQPYDIVRELDDGNYVVVDPEHCDGFGPCHCGQAPHC